MTCFKHDWSEWGPPYEGIAFLGRRGTYQQRQCKRCGARQKRRIGPACHAQATVPVIDPDRLLEAPGQSAPEVEKPRQPRPPRSRSSRDLF